MIMRERRQIIALKLKMVIADKVKKVVEENGQITLPSVLKIINKFESKFEITMSSKLDLVLCVVQNGNKESRYVEEVNEYRRNRLIS